MKSFIIIISIAFLSLSCAVQKPKISKSTQISKWLDSTSLLDNSFVGIKIFDPKSQEILFAKNENKYFTPASNTKILTLYACLKSLGDSIPALKYTLKNDSLFVVGTGDPTFLHPDLPLSNTYNFLKNTTAKTIVFSGENFKNEALGLGWSWDDYNDDYQAELSAFPIYGNILRITKTAENQKINPNYFSNSFVKINNEENSIRRKIDENVFYKNEKTEKKKTFRQDIPFKTSDLLLEKLLKDTLQKEVVILPFKPNSSFKTLYSLPVDTIYRRMMQVSDNMLAEHLLLLAGGKYSDSISSSKSIENVQTRWMNDMPQKFNWVDGSGLSRYNLFTPNSLVHLLDKMLNEFPKERIFSLMAIGGKAGTLKSAYNTEKPFVFAKSGSMSGVYNQSGYIIAKSGRLLIFSFMNNNFTGSISKYRNKTSEILTWIHENY